MNLASVIIIIIFLVLVVLGILIIGVINKLSFYKNRIIDKFEAINNSLNERIGTSNKIINLLKVGGYNEDELIIQLNNLSNEIKDENDVNNLLVLIDKSDDILTKALSLESIYDNLSSNNEYQELINNFKNNQYKIMYAIEIYNEEVSGYNNYKEKRGINIVSKLFRFGDYNYYKK